MYPEVYRVVYPMVCFACDNIRTPVTEEMLDMMTDDIYDRVEADGRINVDISVEVRNNEEVVAYMKINFDKAQTEEGHNNTLEVQRIYILKEYKGKGPVLYPISIEAAENPEDELVYFN